MSENTPAVGQGANQPRAGANRRDFMKTTAAVGLSAFVVGRGAWADDANPAGKSPSEKVNIACVGVGGKGDSDSTHAGMYGNVVAICDIDDKILAKKAAQYPKAEKFNDFRKMFDALGKSIDAVTVSTPDNTHAVVAMMAIKAGKHVYCQKPLTRTIREARELRMAARQYKICTQMGNQGTATDDLRRGVEILRAGVLGDVKEVHVFTNRPIWPQAPKLVTRPPEEPTPAHVHWDEWIGPAKMRPFSTGYHTFKWRGFWDFGTGALGDMACHTANMPYMGLELGYPTSVEGKSDTLNDETYPGWATVVFHFPARGDRPPVKLTWWEGHKPDPKDPSKVVRNIPDKGVTKGFDLPESGSLCIGDKGMMISMSDYGTNNKIIFDGNTDGIVCNPPKLLPRHSDGGKKFNNDEAQKAEWIAAIKAGKHEIALSNFDYSGMLSEFVLMGNVGIKVPAKKLLWDGPGMKFTNDEAANQLLHREYREGWTL